MNSQAHSYTSGEITFGSKWNISLTYSYRLFGINKTESIFQFYPEYQNTYYSIVRSVPTEIPIQNPALFQVLYLTQKARPETEPFVVYQVTPKSLAQGAAQVGGLASFLGIIVIALRFYNRKRINDKLDKIASHSGKEGTLVFSFEEYSLKMSELENHSKQIKEINERMRKNEVELAILQGGKRRNESEKERKESRFDIEQINATVEDQLLTND
ncbi:hypothetical protein FGO68_gene14461 [Halteria grandinella]|uniref:Uncharacterized protein n=1 Tax=Halteria grandinella TaxID=5974 RepID=A0A8J8T234_HALGN|nr:hypothetical protein FGO68_gene14461 [Halteria grandinella]